jgi:hypothetical protein
MGSDRPLLKKKANSHVKIMKIFKENHGRRRGPLGSAKYMVLREIE